jgi:folate-dependent phosphoribosylglycinamide formyltransferase PurN
MRALVLTSTSLRHRYFAQAIGRAFDAPVALAEAKKNYYVAQRSDSPFVARHFETIAEAEKNWFASAAEAGGPSVREVADINDPALVEWASGQGYDVVCLFGTAILKGVWLDAFPDRIVNLHLGLSPFYRGSATLFWPFFHRELECLGTTIHLATAKVDAGGILARVLPDLRAGESYYDITSRLIRDSIDRFPAVVADYLAGRCVPSPQEAITGKLCRKADFSEDALRGALEYVGDGLSGGEIVRIEERRKCLCLP